MVANLSAKSCSCFYYDTAAHHSICIPLNSGIKTCIMYSYSDVIFVICAENITGKSLKPHRFINVKHYRNKNSMHDHNHDDWIFEGHWCVREKHLLSMDNWADQPQDT